MKTATEWATALVDARPAMVGSQSREEVIASLASIIETIQADATAECAAVHGVAEAALALSLCSCPEHRTALSLALDKMAPLS